MLLLCAIDLARKFRTEINGAPERRGFRSGPGAAVCAVQDSRPGAQSRAEAPC